MNYLGDYQPGQIVHVWFNTFSSNDPSASVTVTNLVDTDILIYKDDSLTQRANTAGVSIDIDVEFTGVHKFVVDTADNTVNDFYEAGHDYACVLNEVTVDAAEINAVIATFSIANRRTAGQMAQTSIEGLTDQNTFTLTSGEASGDDDAYNDCIIVVTDQVTQIQKAVGYISDYTGSTRSVQLYADPLQTGFTMAIGDSVEIFATSAFSNVHTVNRTAQTANDNGADINTLITEVGTAGDGLTAINLPNQTMDITGDITGNLSGSAGSVSGAVGSVAGNVDGSVGSVTGHTNQTADHTANISSILTDTGTTLDGRIPGALVGGRMNSDVGAISTSTAAADNLEASAEVIVIGAAEAGTLSTTQMTSDLTEVTDDHYNGRIVIWTSGALQDQASDITAYLGATGRLTYTAVTEAPSAADTFVIV